MKNLEPSGIGIVVDKSNATKIVLMKSLPFPKGCRLNKPYEEYWEKLKEKGLEHGMSVEYKELQRIHKEIQQKI